MKNFISKIDKKFMVVVLVSVFCWLFSMIIVKTDTNFSYRWIALVLHFLSFLPILIFIVFKEIININHKIFFTKKEIIYFIVILVLAIISNFAFLKSYPFVSLGDEVRDGGLNAQEIATGNLKNIFGYGRYEAHGLIIPTITSFFYKIFGGSVFTYRLPAALFSISEVVLIYIFVNLAFGKTAAFWSALTLIASPIHLFYSRTEIVIILSSFFTTLMLLILFLVSKRKGYLEFALLGITLGFSFNFHASVKMVAFIISLVTVFRFLAEIIFIKLEKINNFKKLLLFVLFLFVGFGPRILSTNLQIFFHTSRFVLGESFSFQTILSLESFQKIVINYFNSLLVWGYKPTTSWYPVHEPIFPLPLLIFFLFGILRSFFKKNEIFSKTLLILAFLIPFTNSALTESINADHRIIPLLPVGAIFVGIGISWFLNLIKYNFLKSLTILLLVCTILFGGFIFFKERLADKRFGIEDYLYMNLIYLIKSNQGIKKENLCLLFSEDNLQKFDLLQYHEQRQFFLPNIFFGKQTKKGIGNNEVFVSSDCRNEPLNLKTITCNSDSPYCSLDTEDKIIIHY